MADQETLSLFNTIVGKIDHLTSEVSDYKTQTSAEIATMKEKQIQSEEKCKQLFVFHNENKDKMTELRTLIDSNAHTVQDLSSNVKNNRTGIEKNRSEIDDLSDEVKKDNTEKGTKKDMWKAVASTIGAMGILFGVVYKLLGH